MSPFQGPQGQAPVLGYSPPTGAFFVLEPFSQGQAPGLVYMTPSGSMNALKGQNIIA